MSATIQALRAIPELQTALLESVMQSLLSVRYLTLAISSSRDPNPIARSLRDLYTTLARSTGGVMPLSFLTVLRAAVPQFSERNRSGNSYAQQGFTSISFSHL